MARRPGLTTERVVDEAVKLADEQGLDAVTLAALAERLGVRSPSLYNHVDGLGSLRRLLALRAGRELAEDLGRATVGKAREDAVMALAQAHRAFIRRHPGLGQASVAAPRKGDTEHQEVAARVLDLCLAALGGFQLERRRALHVVRVLRSAVHGFATLEVGGGFGLPLDVNESFTWMVQALARGITQPGPPKEPGAR